MIAGLLLAQLPVNLVAHFAISLEIPYSFLVQKVKFLDGYIGIRQCRVEFVMGIFIIIWIFFPTVERTWFRITATKSNALIDSVSLAVLRSPQIA